MPLSPTSPPPPPPSLTLEICCYTPPRRLKVAFGLPLSLVSKSLHYILLLLALSRLMTQDQVSHGYMSNVNLGALGLE